MNLIGIPANQGKSIMAILQSRKSWLRQMKHLNLDFKDYRMTLIGNPANQDKSIMVILQSSKSWLRHRLLMEHFAEMYVETPTTKGN